MTPTPSGAASALADEPRYGWVVVGACFVALAVIFGVSYSFAAFFEPFAREFAASRADVSLVFGVSGLLYFLLGAGGGMLADRFGPRVVTSAGMVCIALALLASSRAQSLTQIVLAQGLGVGIGIALVYTPAIGACSPGSPAGAGWPQAWPAPALARGRSWCPSAWPWPSPHGTGARLCWRWRCSHWCSGWRPRCC
jgi:MFS family permease